MIKCISIRNPSCFLPTIMTRVTSFGIKRTYVEAGFDEPRQPEPSTSAKKKSKRPEQERKAKCASVQLWPAVHPIQRSSCAASFDRKSASETRRQGRIAERQADTICFAYREKGHAARDCPTSKTAEGRTKNVVGICYRCVFTSLSTSAEANFESIGVALTNTPLHDAGNKWTNSILCLLPPASYAVRRAI